MKKFNVIDIIIVVVLIAAVCAGFIISGGKNKTDATKVITVEIAEKREGFSENIVIGDKVTDKIEKKELGVITGFEVKPCEKNSYDRVSGKTFIAVVPKRENIYVSIKADANAEIEVGKSVSVISKHFAGAGYVVGVEYNEGGEEE